MARRPSRRGSNPARIAAVQARLRSGGYGTHKRPDDVRSARERAALEDQEDEDSFKEDWDDQK